MCTGFEMFLIGSTGLSAASSRKAGRDQQRANDANARQAEEDAEAEKAASAVRAGLIRRGGKRQQSAARAAYAASGVQADVGSAGVVDREIGRSAEEDALNELLHGDRLGARYAQEAENQRTAGRVARSAADREAGGSILIGGAQLARGWKTSRGAGEPILLAKGGETV